MLPLERIRNALLARRRELFEQVAHVEDDLRWLDVHVAAETEEEGQEENIARLLARLDERGKAEIDAIDRAMIRIANGDYGYCTDCGEGIAPARLEVQPTTALCRACAEKREGRAT